MSYKKEIEEEIKSVESLKDLTEAFGEIAATRMRKIRGYVLRNREYLSSIDSIFQDTLNAYTSKLAELVKTGKVAEGGKVTFLAHNGKTVSVLISANTGFFGEVVKATFDKFIDDVRKSDTEVTIIGRVGRSLFLSYEPKRPYTYFDLPDFGIDSGKLAEAIRHLVQYEEIRLYFGKYQSVVTQTPELQRINSGTEVTSKLSQPAVSFIFEPTIESILMFFETQIFASLFDQSIRESQLAKFASRILAMDSATQAIDKRIYELKVNKLKVAHDVTNRKQINNLAPILY